MVCVEEKMLRGEEGDAPPSLSGTQHGQRQATGPCLGPGPWPPQGKTTRACPLGYLEVVPVCPVPAGFLRASIHQEQENLEGPSGSFDLRSKDAHGEEAEMP